MAVGDVDICQDRFDGDPQRRARRRVAARRVLQRADEWAKSEATEAVPPTGVHTTHSRLRTASAEDPFDSSGQGRDDAYARSDLFDKRREPVSKWATFVMGA
jgi:hypothetical protein